MNEVENSISFFEQRDLRALRKVRGYQLRNKVNRDFKVQLLFVENH